MEKATVQNQVDIRSYKMYTEDGQQYRRNKQDIRVSPQTNIRVENNVDNNPHETLRQSSHPHETIRQNFLFVIKTAPLNPNRLTLTFCQGHSIENTMYINTNKASQSEPPYSITSLVPLLLADYEM